MNGKRHLDSRHFHGTGSFQQVLARGKLKGHPDKQMVIQ